MATRKPTKKAAPSSAKEANDLARYNAKRDFTVTPEPAGRVEKQSRHRYLIQKHAASRLHYDFRLELDGVLKSWAVTKGPSLDPHDRRLAVEVEDHPVSYGSFEGIIPKGQYGGGTVMLWDQGEWEPIGDPHEGLKKGKLEFRLHGKRLQGEWTLVRMHTRDGKRNNWLLIKRTDDEAKPGDADQFLANNATSVTSGRKMEQIAEAGDRVWQSKGASAKKPVGATATAAVKKSSLPFPAAAARAKAGRKTLAMPGFIPPELATLTDAMPKGAHWLHEIKFDGYRALAYVSQGKVQIFTRAGNDWTATFRPIARTLEALAVENAVLDGEIVALNDEDASSFKRLQDALSEGGKTDELQYYVFDLLHLDGRDLRPLPLLKRKELLALLLKNSAFKNRIILSEHFAERDDDFLQNICRLHLEGVVSKRADAPYGSGRSKAWLKTKCHLRQEFVIGGFTLPTAGARGVGALLLGYYEEEELRYAGKVGTGFDTSTSLSIRKQLDALRTDKQPYAGTLTSDARRGANWVQPKLVCEVEFTEWTPDGRLRHPSFQGLREDKPAREVKRDIPVHVSDAKFKSKSVAAAAPAKTVKEKPKPIPAKTVKAKGPVIGGITISHPDRVIYPEEGLTKVQLAEYYDKIAGRILPYISGRPLSMLRCPEGSSEPCFFQRHVGLGVSPHIHEVKVKVKDRTEPYLYIKDEPGLISLAQWGVIELHPWGCHKDNLYKPDQLVFDFDPDPGIEWKRVIEGVRDIKARMDELGLKTFLKTTGGKGLHVVLPMTPFYGWKPMKEFARAIAQSMTQDQPERYTATLSKAARKGRIFVDYLRNDVTSTAVAPYSARARAHATVAMPLHWEQLTEKLKPADYTIKTVPDLLAKQKADPWKDFLRTKQKIPAKYLRALKIDPDA